MCVCSASSVVKNDASFSSVSVATGKPYLAAGSDKNGIVAVWDYVTEAELACDKFRHAHKGSTKVELAPLSPSLLYSSAGMDGILKVQDLRLPSSIASPTAMASRAVRGWHFVPERPRVQRRDCGWNQRRTRLHIFCGTGIAAAENTPCSLETRCAMRSAPCWRWTGRGATTTSRCTRSRRSSTLSE